MARKDRSDITVGAFEKKGINRQLHAIGWGSGDGVAKRFPVPFVRVNPQRHGNRQRVPNRRLLLVWCNNGDLPHPAQCFGKRVDSRGVNAVVVGDKDAHGFYELAGSVNNRQRVLYPPPIIPSHTPSISHPPHHILLAMSLKIT